MNLTISPENTKLGRIPNLSHPPIIGCRPDAPCTTDCYALKAWRQYPQTRAAWRGNLSLWEADPAHYRADLYSYLSSRRYRTPFFRFFVAGDIPSQAYATMMIHVAHAFPSTSFLCFTKQYALDWRARPSNLTILWSAWPGFPLPKKPRSVSGIAWLDDGTETRIPRHSRYLHHCAGNCTDCQHCFTLTGPTNHIVLPKH